MAILEKLVRDHRENKFNPFVALVTWEPDDNREAAKRLMEIHDKLDTKFGIKDGHAWYLAGKRTMIVIGFTDDSRSSERFSLFMTVGTNIKVEPSYAITAHELFEEIKNIFKGK